MGPRRKSIKASLTPEEKLFISVRAKRRFKAVVRLAAANSYWLQELDADSGKLGDNVLKNVLLLTRKKETKSPLSLQEKALLTIPTKDRTEDDKARINRAIGALKCFRRYPPDVKAQLAAVTYFVYYGPGRVIVKQSHPPFAMYFILTGDVAIDQKCYDRLSNDWITADLGIMGPGTMFGEVALLLDIPRTATITTLTSCELLKINKEDFDIVLKATVWSSWEDLLEVMNKITYFDTWDSLSRRECCIMSRRIVFNPGEIVFGGDVGLLNYVYFIIKGSCYIVEHLMLQVYYKNNVKKYRLYNGDLGPENVGKQQQQVSDEIKVILAERMEKEESVRSSKDKERKRSSIRAGSIIIVEESHSVSSQVTEYELKSKSRQNAGKPRTIEIQDTNTPANVETYFIKVCDITQMACFNIGESFKRRHVVARTETECMLIPHYWLTQKTKNNVWNRLRDYLDLHIPTTEQIFHDFLEQNKWTRYKKQLVNHILSKKQLARTNTIHNVPYSIRIKESANNR